MELLGNEETENVCILSLDLYSGCQLDSFTGFSDVILDSNDPKLRSSFPKLASLPNSVSETMVLDSQSRALGKILIFIFVLNLSPTLLAVIHLRMSLSLTFMSHDFKVIACKSMQN